MGKLDYEKWISYKEKFIQIKLMDRLPYIFVFLSPSSRIFMSKNFLPHYEFW